MVYVRLMCTANFIALNLEAYEVVSQLIFGQSKIGFAENFLPPNLGDYEVACHTSEAPGLPLHCCMRCFCRAE